MRDGADDVDDHGEGKEPGQLEEGNAEPHACRRALRPPAWR